MTIPKTYFAAFALSAAAHSACLIMPGSWHWSGGSSQEDYILVDLEVSAPAFTAEATTPDTGSAPESKSPESAKAPGHADRSTQAGPAALPAVSSKELLSDPQTGKIFSAYFQTVRSRIQEVAERHKRYVLRQNGKIEIDFVLRRDGRIAALDAHPDSRAKGDPLLVSRALDIIRSSQPFTEFPAEIPAEAISFNITLVFDG